MTDLSQTIIAKSDQLNADDLMGGPRTVKITRVSADPSNPEQPVTIYYEGDQGRPFKPCKSMRRVMVAIWGSDSGVFPGHAMTLYRDPGVMFGGMKVGGIRISHMTGIDNDTVIPLMVTRGKKAPYKVKPLRAAPPPSTGEVIDRDGLVRSGEEAAGRGTDALKAWWGDLSKPAKHSATSEMDRLKRLAADVDRQASEEGGSDPFLDTPDEDPSPLTAEQRAALEEAECEVREQEKRDREGAGE